MRYFRVLLLATSMAVIAVAVTPTPAGAIVVAAPEAGGSCGTITPPTSHGPGTGGCAFSPSSVLSIELGTPLGMITCRNSMFGKLSQLSEGYFYNQTLTVCSPVTTTPCTSPEGGTDRTNWPAEMTSETNMEMVMCVTAFGITVNCHLPNITVSQDASHFTTLTTGASHEWCEGSTSNSVQATWRTGGGGSAVEFFD